jgi:23S rRNA pseudouridine1911/1915/1917 synthase
MKPDMTREVIREAEREKRGKREMTRLCFEVKEAQFKRLGDWLMKKAGFSAKAINRLKNRGWVEVNGRFALMKDEIHLGDKICVYDPVAAVNPYLRPEPMDLDICYEDEDVLVVNKPPGICVHPNRRYPRGALIQGVMYHWEVSGGKVSGGEASGGGTGRGRAARPHLINRLDKDTSGLVLVAKHAYAAQWFFREQALGRLKRDYLALAEGDIETETGYLDWPLAKEEGWSIRRLVNGSGQPAKTGFRVLERLDGHTLLNVWLETGRTHQIRAHFSHWGFPLAGDVLYGGGRALAPRQFLHAHRLEFRHPFQEGEMYFEAALPKDLRRTLDGLRDGRD